MSLFDTSLRKVALVLVGTSVIMLALSSTSRAVDSPAYGGTGSEYTLQDFSLPGNPNGAGSGILTNPSFETGNLNGWGTADVGDGAFAVLPAGAPLQSGLSAPVPPDGVFQAITDQGAPGAHVVYQEFEVPAGGQVEFDLWWDNQAGVWFNAGDLSPDGDFNQHARVDLLTTGSDPFGTGGEVLDNLFTLDSGPFQSGYEHFVFDISGFAGDEVRLRFAEVDNQFFFNFAVDNVVVTPEPAALAMLGFGALLIGRRRRRGR